MTTKTARIEVFRPGTFTPMEGSSLTYSAADLRAVVDAYDPATAPAPIVVGHPQTDAPAFGWVQSFDYDATAERLYATVGEIDAAFADAVKAGRYKKVSLSFFRPDSAANPVPGTWYPRHVGFLGGAAPGVPGLKNVQFSSGEGVATIAAFGEAGFEETASILRSLRDFFIERFGIEEADKALPSWRIEWLGETEIEKPGFGHSFTAPKTPIPQKEPPAVTKQPDPAFAVREAEVAAREQRLAERERTLAHADHVAFAEGLVAAGKLLPVSKDKVVALLDNLPAEASVSFAEGGEKVAPAAVLREILEAQPTVVSFGEFDLPGEPGKAGAASFAADGKPVDPGGLALDAKAQAYMRDHPGTPYLAAVQAVS